MMEMSNEMKAELRERLAVIERDIATREGEQRRLAEELRELSVDRDAVLRVLGHRDAAAPDHVDGTGRLTIIEHAVRYAHANGGLVKVAEFAKTLSAFGFKSDQGGVYTMLSNSPRFQKANPGMFRLLG
jgi:hypothetical protein